MDRIITSYLTGQVDNQRGIKWDASEEPLRTLATSCAGYDYRLVVLNDCFANGLSMGAEFVYSADTGVNPYFERWIRQRDYLIAHPEIERAYFVDATDVELLYDPFHDMASGKIYVGDEFDTVGSEWMRNMASGKITDWVNDNADLLLLNCGVLGGHRDDLIAICNDMLYEYGMNGCRDTVEMPIFNYVLRTKYNDRIVRGRDVTTVFKADELIKTNAIWRHK
jgi:hypothetical protein